MYLLRTCRERAEREREREVRDQLAIDGVFSAFHTGTFMVYLGSSRPGSPVRIRLVFPRVVYLFLLELGVLRG